MVARAERNGTGCGQIAVHGRVGAFEYVDLFDDVWDEKVQIGIALAVAV